MRDVTGASRLQFDGIPIRDLLDQSIPRTADGNDDFFLYIMGPYTAFDLAYARAGGNVGPNHTPDFIDDPLFDPGIHTGTGDGTYEAALKDLCRQLRTETGVRAFIATDVNIPMPSQVGVKSPSLTPLEQSLYLSAASDGVAFVFSHAALNAGVGTELGAILTEFNFRPKTQNPLHKHRDRIRLFSTKGFGSATVDATPMDFSIEQKDFSSRKQLVDNITVFCQ